MSKLFGEDFTIEEEELSDIQQKEYKEILTEELTEKHLKEDIMENKYYTPEIEEFHPGFEYEHKLYYADDVNLNPKTLGDTIVPKKWIKREVWYIWIDEIYNAYIENESVKDLIRVKYLDEDDIKSYGFEHDQTTKDGVQYIKGSLLDDNVWHLFYKDRYVHIFNQFSDKVFNGQIKNKSELKIVLKMLGIK
jgi:hypothetical protein